MRELFDGRPDVMIRATANGWLVYAERMDAAQRSSYDAYTFNTADYLAEFIQTVALEHEDHRGKPQPKGDIK